MRLQTLKTVLPLVAGLLAAGRLTASVLAPTPTWTPLGPFGGSVQALTVDPHNAAVVYAVLDGLAFRSADGGGAWNLLPAGFTNNSLAVDPFRTATLYLAATGVQKSTDGGAHWTTVGLKTYAVNAVAVDPAVTSHLYAGTSANGVFRSADGGASWQGASHPLPAGDARRVATLAVPRTGSVVFAGTGAGVYKSADGARTWQPASRGMPAGAILALAVAPGDPKTVYASVENRLANTVYRSTDGGASWRATAGLDLPPATPGAPGAYVLSLAVSPASPRLVWAGTGTGGLFLSTDGGAHWTPSGPSPARSVPALAVAASAARSLYAGVLAEGLDLGGVFASADGGASWTRRNQGLSGLEARSLAVSPGTPEILWAAIDGEGLFRSANGGSHWTRVPLPDPTLNNGIPLLDVEVAPSVPSTLYSLALNWLWRTTGSGASSTEIYAYPNGPSLQFLRVDPTDPLHLWGGVPGEIDDSVVQSRDGGATWNPLVASVPACGSFDLQFAPSSPSTLYLAGASPVGALCREPLSAVLRSTDGGATWTEADGGLTGGTVTRLAIDPHDPGLLYAGTGGGEDPASQGSGVWKSADGGISWTPTGNELTGTIAALTVSPNGVVWAAGEGEGVFRSGDGGASWQGRGAGLQGLYIYRLAIDPADPRRVYAATSGGIWRLEDDAP
jgi:photosystem II stability/assembly factor-like uncharacterized protein